MATPKYLAFDPGKTAGYAFFDDEGNCLRKGEESHTKLEDSLVLLSAAPKEVLSNLVVIVEDWKLLEHKARSVARNVNSRSMEASQLIGALRLFSKLSKCKFELQKPEFGTKVAAGWTGLSVPQGQHLANWKSAYNHGIYYLVTNKILSLDQVMNSATP